MNLILKFLFFLSAGSSLIKIFLIWALLLIGYWKIKAKSLLYWFFFLVLGSLIRLPLNYINKYFVDNIMANVINNSGETWMTNHMTVGQFAILWSYGMQTITTVLVIIGIIWLYYDLIRPKLGIQLSVIPQKLKTIFSSN